MLKLKDIAASAKRSHDRKRSLAAILLGAGIVAATVLPANAAQQNLPDTDTGVANSVPTKPRGNLEALKAQMNALQGGLENIRRLREYFDDADFNENTVLSRAERLLKTLPQHEGAEQAAWRIAAVASLTLNSGRLADVEVDDTYRLSAGAMGWDLGPEGAGVHPGFVPVTPRALDPEGTVIAVEGETALTDGILAPKKFQASLPNGLYKVLIVRDETDAPTAPFGESIYINGATMKEQIGDSRDRLQLTGRTDKVASNAPVEARVAALGLGIEGWAIVEDGKLNVDFGAAAEGRAITAIIAEPIEIDNVDLNATVMETLAEAVGDIEPAAGPEARIAPPGPRFSSFGGRVIPTVASTAPAPSSKPQGSKASAPARPQSPSPTSFSATRAFTEARTGADSDTETENREIAINNDNTPAFEDRQILVKRSASEGDDTPGVAVDLGSLLDEASPSGVFMCLTDPCEDLDPVAPEPDLAAAAELLGNWLDDPENLPEDWTTLLSVLEGRADGSEIATIYEFEIGTESWTDVELRASTGGGLFVWLDGDYIFGASDSSAFVDDLNFDYILELPDLAGGKHYLQVLSESHGSEPGFAFELRGTSVGSPIVSAASVPEPGTALLLIAGIAGLSLFRRCRTVQPA